MTCVCEKNIQNNLYRIRPRSCLIQKIRQKSCLISKEINSEFRKTNLNLNCNNLVTRLKLHICTNFNLFLYKFINFEIENYHSPSFQQNE